MLTTDRPIGTRRQRGRGRRRTAAIFTFATIVGVWIGLAAPASSPVNPAPPPPVAAGALLATAPPP